MLYCTSTYDSNFYLSVSGYNLSWFSLMILLGLRWMLRSFSSLPDRLPPRVQWSISSLPDRQPPSAHVWYVPACAVKNGGNDKHYRVLDSGCARIMTGVKKLLRKVVHSEHPLFKAIVGNGNALPVFDMGRRAVLSACLFC